MSTTRTISIELPPVAKYQQDAIFAPERFVVIEATTKAGKTWGCICWLLMMAGTGPGEYWWVAPVYEQTKIAYRRFKRALGEASKGTAWTCNESELYITLANGAVIRFKSADKPDSLFGEDVLAAVMDESTRCKEDAWFALRSTLTATKGPCRIIGNVKGRKNWSYNLARRAQQGRKDWKYAKITAADAVREGILSQAEIDEAEQTLPHHVFRELYHAEASEDGSNPFGMREIAACANPNLSASEPVVFGIDLARKQDYTVVIGLDQDGSVCRFHRWNGGTWLETERRISSIVGQTPALADATGVGDSVVESLRATCHRLEGFVFTSSSKQHLMSTLAIAIQACTVGVFDPGDAKACPLRSELESFEFHVSGGKGGRLPHVSYGAPEGMHDDCVCALALAVVHREAASKSRYSMSIIHGGRR